MKRSVVLLALATLLLAVLAYGQEAQKPAKEAPAPGQRLFFPAAPNLREMYGEALGKPVAVVGTVYCLPDLGADPEFRWQAYGGPPTFLWMALSDEAERILGDEGRLTEMVRPAIQGYYANLKEDGARNLAAEAAKVLVRGRCPLQGQGLGRFPAQAVAEAVMRLASLLGLRTYQPAMRVERAQPVTSDLPLCQVLLVTNEPDLGVEVVSSLCQELARTLADSELRLAKDTLSESRTALEESEKKQGELEVRKKELEEKYKFYVHSEEGKDNAVYIRGAEFTAPLRDKLAKLQELQFGNDLRWASVQAQLDYVRTNLAKEAQAINVAPPPERKEAVESLVRVLMDRLTDVMTGLKEGRDSVAAVNKARDDVTKVLLQVPGETVSTINPVWTSLKQRLVELETESIGLKATGDRLKQMLAETERALDDAGYYLLSLTKTLGQLERGKGPAKFGLASLPAAIARIEREGPLPLPYVVESTRPEDARPVRLPQPTTREAPGPAGSPAR